METLQEEDQTAYQKQFSQYIAKGLDSEGLPAMWEAAHKAIREDPNKARDPLSKGSFSTRSKPLDANFTYPKKSFSKKRISVQQRKNRVRQKLLAMGRSAQIGIAHSLLERSYVA